MTEKKDFKVDGKCSTTCLEETENCAGYKRSIIFGGCIYLGRQTGKCMRPEK